MKLLIALVVVALVWGALWPSGSTRTDGRDFGAGEDRGDG